MSPFEYIGAGPTCPDVFRIHIHPGNARPCRVRTLVRAVGEDDASFCARAQAACFLEMAATSYAGPVLLFCDYGPTPADPVAEDARLATRVNALHTLNDTSAPRKARLEAARALCRLHGMPMP